MRDGVPRAPSAADIQRTREEHLGRLLLFASRRHHEAVVNVMNALGFRIRAVHAAVIRHVHVDGSRITDVAEQAGMTKQAVGQLLMELERAGYVRRTTAVNDRRVKMVVFTAKGRRFAAAIGTAVKTADESFARSIGPRRLRALYATLRRLLPGVALLLALLARPPAAAAQNNFEIQVYGAETTAPGSTMIELHSNSAIKGTTRKEGRVLPTQHAAHETLEITHGFTSWFETALYVFTSVQPDTGWEWVGNHLRPRVRAPERWRLPVGLGLSAEIGYQRPEFSADTWTLELRPIIDQQVGPWYWAFNPVFDHAIRGENGGRGLEFSPAAKVSYSVTPKLSGGLEFYGAVGPLDRIDPGREQQHQIFPVVDIDLGPRWEFNFGIGIGLTPSTDSLLVKMILGYRFDSGSSPR